MSSSDSANGRPDPSGEVTNVSGILDGSVDPAAAKPSPQRRSGASEGFARTGGEVVRAAGSADTSDAVAIARVAGATFWRLMKGISKNSLAVGKEIATEVRSGEPVSAIIDHRVEDVRNAAVSALGLDSTNDAIPIPRAVRNGSPARRTGGRGGGTTPAELRQAGNALLASSWRASNQPRTQHPAFGLILQSLTPDEARILRFLAVGGPQPSVDVRTKTPFGVGSEMLSSTLNLVADMAGCSWPDKDQEYLANLSRLGLVVVSKEPVEDFRRYSFIECQPKVVEVMESVKKATTVYGSIYLTTFGSRFCEMVFDLGGYNAGGWDTDDRGDHIIGRGGPKPKKKHAH